MCKYYISVRGSEGLVNNKEFFSLFQIKNQQNDPVIIVAPPPPYAHPHPHPRESLFGSCS